ncbi:TetR/AcrR family transcriptional regulator [Aeromicrobium endophyticum]|uniref:TetR/AcrR family transcriptional regulator n=1 Tax=Aeromicrobium endophyticum TaxID=2292704 RepID=A0A371P3L4_9ACTN|nr:TetR/AcrR family transcriptional regulator [Aeromicrobium endophyticum]REK70511.1 TetR/AcrR family transcriptional regulator [Aeromicrobium endophyticum]
MEHTRTARERAREEITTEILEAARRRLASDGPANLSLRAVARDVGMVSSAVYRYVPSRDDLLTALLVEAYDELGAAAEAADDGVSDRTDVRARWTATCRAVRSWSVGHPHDYALLYGSPVIGYAAPRDTVGPATRVIVRLVGIISSAHEIGGAARPLPEGPGPSFEPSVGDATAALREVAGLDTDVPPELVGRTLMAWSTVFGTISFELWGHLVGSVSDHETYFDSVVSRLWHDLGGV